MEKKYVGLGMPWEKDYGYAQAVKSGSTVWLAGQVGHDENGVLAAGMEAQVRLAYRNIEKLLQKYGMSMDDVVEEVLYVLDLKAAFDARRKIGKTIYKEPMGVASTLIEVKGLVLPGQVIEIKIVAKQQHGYSSGNQESLHE